jgi:hypothetical protein
MGHRIRTRRKPCAWTADSARDRAIQTAIGRVLQTQYDLAAPLPERLETLLKRLEDANESHARAERVLARASPGAGLPRNWHRSEAL